MEPEYYRQMAALQQDHWWYKARRIILQSLIKKYLPQTKVLDILEAGCGPGANLAMLQEFGTVYAFEPEDWAVEHAKSLTGLEIKSGGLPEPIPFSQNFDLVCAFDVIEHIENDQAAVAALFEKTKPGGYAVFTVPAHQWLWSAHDEINHHKRRYSYKNFYSLMREGGFDVQKISYLNMMLFPVAAFVRLIKNIFRLSDINDVKMPPLLINHVLYFIFSIERFLLPYIRLPFGLSIVVVARRSL